MVAKSSYPTINVYPVHSQVSRPVPSRFIREDKSAVGAKGMVSLLATKFLGPHIIIFNNNKHDRYYLARDFSFFAITNLSVLIG